MRGIGALVLSLSTVAALADQCAWVSESTARAALDKIRPAKAVVQYCEPCGESEPKLIPVTTTDIRKVEDQDYFELTVNGNPEDLAYLFIPQAGTTYRNLGKLTDCGATGVSLKIEYPPTGAPRPLWRSQYRRDKGGATLNVNQENQGPAVQIRFNRISERQGDSRAEVQGPAEIAAGKVLFDSPFPGCAFQLDRREKKVIVGSQGNCGAMGVALAGEYLESK